MRKPHAYTLAVVILVTGAGCARKDNPPQPDQPVETGAMGHTQQRVSLRGCVQAAPGFDEFILHRVSIAADRLAEQEAIAERALILPGSWVRLQGGTADLRSYLGKEVSLVGRIVDSGANTIGTSTPPARPTDRAMPPSSVPPPASDANGAPPQITVEQISVVGQTCD